MKKPQVNLGLINLKNSDNVGSVLRAAANYGIDKVSYTGDRYPARLSVKQE